MGFTPVTVSNALGDDLLPWLVVVAGRRAARWTDVEPAFRVMRRRGASDLCEGQTLPVRHLAVCSSWCVSMAATLFLSVVMWEPPSTDRRRCRSWRATGCGEQLPRKQNRQMPI